MTETRFYEPARLSTPVKPLSLLSKVFRFNSWLAAVRHFFIHSKRFQEASWSNIISIFLLVGTWQIDTYTQMNNLDCKKIATDPFLRDNNGTRRLSQSQASQF